MQRAIIFTNLTASIAGPIVQFNLKLTACQLARDFIFTVLDSFWTPLELDSFALQVEKKYLSNLLYRFHLMELGECVLLN